MIKIPCDYKPKEPGEHLDNGQILIYGEMPVPPPRYHICPKCEGTNFILVTKTVIKNKIDKLLDKKSNLKRDFTSNRTSFPG